MKKNDIIRTPESQIIPEHGWREHKPQIRSLDMPIFSSPKRILIIVAHPDDADFTCGGLLQRLNDEGCETILYSATSGQKGRSIKSHPNVEDFVEMRKREQRASAKILGIAEVRFGNYVDGETFSEHQTMVEEFVHLIRTVRPHVVVTPDPYTRLYRQHPDHRNVGLATLEAVFPAAGMDTYFSKQLEENDTSPWWVEETWLIFSDQEHIAVELSKQHVETKVTALQQHWTQKNSHETSQEYAVRNTARTAHRKLEWAETFGHSPGNV